MPLHVLLFGPPGSGKSTQGALLAQRQGVPHVSIGDLLRAEVARGSAPSQNIAREISRGAMVADDVIMDLLREHLGEMEGGFILDGFPRTAAQLPLLEQLCEELGFQQYLVIDLDLPRAESYDRLMSRGRGDDKPEVINRRLDAYQNMAGPVLGYFKSRDRLTVLDATGSVEEVGARLDRALNRSDQATATLSE